MKIIDYKPSIALGHDGVDYFVANKEGLKLVFRYLRTGLELGSLKEIGAFRYLYSRGNYAAQAWELIYWAIFHGHQIDTVKKGTITRLDYNYKTVSESNHLPPYSGFSPHWCIVVYSTDYDNSGWKTFKTTLKLLGQEYLSSKLSLEAQILIVNRLSGEIHAITSPFDVAEKVVIALDEQTFAIPGRGQIAIIDLNF